MLNNDTRTLLKSLLQVNNEMIIEPIMHGCDEFKSILFRANLKELGDDFEPFGIFDATSFLSALELLEQPEISIEGNILTAENELSTMKFVTSGVSTLGDVQINPKVIDTTLDIPTILDFTLDNELITKIKKSASVFKTFDTIFLINTPKGTEIKMGAKDSFSKSNNSFSIKVETDISTSNEFELAIPLDGLLKVPGMDYNLMVKYNEEKDAYRIVLDNKLLTFVMSLKK